MAVEMLFFRSGMEGCSGLMARMESRSLMRGIAEGGRLGM